MSFQPLCQTIYVFSHDTNAIWRQGKNCIIGEISPEKEKIRIIRTGKGILINLGGGVFDVTIVQLIEADVDLLLQDGTVTMG